MTTPVYLGVDEFEVASWSAGADGAGVPPTQVHVLYRVPQLEATFAIRLKSAAVCDSLIEALIEHRYHVFGDPTRQASEGSVG